MARSAAIVELRGISRTFGRDINALIDVDLCLERGVSYAVTGPSGSGKSTFLNIIGLLDRPSSGQYFIDGHEAAQASDLERANGRRDMLGFVFQDFHLLPQRSALENIMLGGYYRGQPRGARAVRARELAEYVGLSDRIEAPAAQLSGGERQRVAIARALMNQPQLLLCDEPTGNLDSQTSTRIMDMLLGLPGDITLVIVTHDSAIASRCERSISVLDGRMASSPRASTATDSPGAACAVPLAPSSTPDGGAGCQAGADAVNERAEPRWRVVAAGVQRACRQAWQLAGESVFCVMERLRSTLFAIIGIAVGVAAVVATVGVAASAGAGVLLGFDTVEARTISARPAGTGAASTRLPVGAEAAVKALAGVSAVGAYTSTGEALARTLPPWEDQLGGTLVKTYNATEGLQAACGCSITAGRWFDSTDSGHARVVLSASTAAALGISRVGGGRAVFVNDDAFEVVGIMSIPAAVPITDGIFTLLGHAEADSQPVDGLIIQAEPGQASVLARAVEIALDPNRTGAVSVSTPVDYTSVQRAVQGDIDSLYIVLGGIAMLVGAIGIASTRLMAVFERSSEIGLRRALGATRNAILAQFALESSIVGLVGGLLGAASGVVAVVAVAVAHGWPPVLAAWIPLAGPPAGLTLGTLAGLYPAHRAARLEPVAALRGNG